METAVPQPTTQERLTQAVGYTTTGWLPVNSSLLEAMRFKLENGGYKTSAAIVDDLKKDFALFASIVGRVSAQMTITERNEVGKRPFQDVLKNCPAELLLTYLPEKPQQATRHSLGQCSQEQAMVLQKAIQAASISSILAEQKNIDEGLAYATSLFRSLGLLLVAWNYPKIFHRAQKKAKTRKDLEKSLNRTLGFSPMMLAITLARRWGLPPEVRSGMNDPAIRNTSLERYEEANRIGRALERTCRAGEAFAEALHPRPGVGGTDKGVAVVELPIEFDEATAKKIQAALRRNLSYYVHSFPDIFPSALEGAKHLFPSASGASKNPQKNGATKNKKLSHDLAQLANTFTPNTVSRESIEQFRKIVLEKSCFSRGCVFLIDPGTEALVPRYSFSKPKRIPLESVSYRASSKIFSPIKAAFQESSIVYDFDEDGMYLAGSLQTAEQRVGVLYLEQEDSSLFDTDESQKEFALLQEALCHVLGFD